MEQWGRVASGIGIRIKIDAVITATLVLCALVTTGLVVRREFFAPTSTPSQAERKPHFIKNWRMDLSKGHRMGLEQAPVQLMEFADFECPYCANFYKDVQALRTRYPTQVALTCVHFPLPMHRFAEPAARVADCAADQGRFEAMYDQLFEGQDRFGLKPWDDYATAASVPDIAAFDACIERNDPIPRVEEGKALGKKLDIQGTPTIIINGWKLGKPPTEAELDQMVQRILAGKPPVDARS
jgi:protein-disulfide isomerase